jgi:non-specific serine/threonine protein kinase
LERRVQTVPRYLTELIGRELEAHALGSLLATERLVTLTGMGGIGKTRLALRVAADRRGAFRDGVGFVDLAPLRDPGLVASALLRSLNLTRGRRQSAAEALAEALRSAHALLVLDNCEHVVEACAELAHELLGEAPSIRILATSRCPLDLPGEIAWRVPPLALPAREAEVRLDELATCAAVRLFVDRARGVAPGFRLDAANADAIADLCRQLEGIPLALQLAAAWVGTLSVQELRERLSDCVGLLSRGPRAVPARHQTLRATLDWSFDLLTPVERRLLRRLAVFDGAFTLDAAESVAADATLPRAEVLPLVARLVDASLLAVLEPADEARAYRLLTPVRQYARQRLAESEAADELRRRHADYYLTLIEQAGPALTGPEQTAWLDRLERELSNLRAAFAWFRTHPDASWSGLRMAIAAWRFWWLRSYFDEGRSELQALLDLAGDDPPRLLRAQVLHALGELAFHQGEVPAARVPLECACSLFQEEGYRLGIAHSLRSLGRLALDEGDHARARELLEADLAIERESRHDVGLPWALTYLGWLAIFDGRLDAASQLLEEGLARCTAFGDREGIARQVFSLGHLALDRGDLAQARARFGECVSMFLELNCVYGLAYGVEGMSDVADAAGQAELAVRLAGYAAAARERAGAGAAAEWRARHARHVQAARQALGARADRVWAEGRGLSGGEARLVALGRSLPTPAPAQPRGLLTARQLEVARLVARGRTNREIAEELVVSVRTADRHVEDILRRLDLNGRAQIGAYIATHCTLGSRPG